MTIGHRYSWPCLVCGRQCTSGLPPAAYDQLCTDCDVRTPSERVQLRIAYMNTQGGTRR